MRGIYNYMSETNHVSRIRCILVLQPVCRYGFGTCNAISHVECFVLIIIIIIIVHC